MHECRRHGFWFMHRCSTSPGKTLDRKCSNPLSSSQRTRSSIYKYQSTSRAFPTRRTPVRAFSLQQVSAVKRPLLPHPLLPRQRTLYYRCSKEDPVIWLVSLPALPPCACPLSPPTTQPPPAPCGIPWRSPSQRFVPVHRTVTRDTHDTT